jgi:multidrug efflux pump subunit AcrB
MNLQEAALRNSAFMGCLLLAMAFLGYQAWTGMPRSEDPYYDSTSFRVSAVLPGADAEEVEREIAEPIEDRINTLEDVEELESTSRDGVMQLRVSFAASSNGERKYDELVREINALAPSLPRRVHGLEVQRNDPSRTNIVQLALVSEEASWGRLADLADDLERRLESVPGVREAASWAYPRRELRVSLDLQRMAGLGLDAGRLIENLEAENENLPAGAVDVGPRRMNLQTSGRYASPPALADTIVAVSGGRITRLSDVAEVAWEYEPETYVGRFNGRRAVFVTAQQKPHRNIFRTQGDMDREVAAFAATLPGDVSLEWSFRQSESVGRRLGRFSEDLAIAIGLVCLTLLPLGPRAAGIVMVSIPLSLAVGLAALNLLGFSLNQLTIAGFIVALGLLVDDAIVVIENIARFMREGHSRFQAALRATRQITPAVIGCTATMLLAFAPLLVLPGNSGKFIRSLPAAVTTTVLASLVVALFIVPWLASRFLSKDSDPHGNRVLRAIDGAIQRFYAPILRLALARPARTLVIAAVAVAATLAIVPVIGLSVFPKAGLSQFLVQIELPEDSSLARTDGVANLVEKELMSRPEVMHVSTSVGRGNPRIYYNMPQHEPAMNYAELFVQLKTFDPKRTPLLYADLKGGLAGVPGARIHVKEFENGPGVEAPIVLRILGPDLGTLRQLAAEVEALLRATPGTDNVNNPLRRSRMDLQLKAGNDQAALLGTTPHALDRLAQLAVAGISVGNFRRADGESYPIVVRAPMAVRPTLQALDGLHVPSSRGGQVALSQLAEPVLVEAMPSIGRFMRQRSAEVTADVREGYNVQKLTHQVIADIGRRVPFPGGYRLDVGGEVESGEESFSGFDEALLMAAFGILAVLVLEFGNLRSTLIVASVVPLGIAGGLLALLLSGYTLGFTAFIGFIALIGIEIKNSLLFVDFANYLRKQDVGLDEAIQRAGEVRFLPILLTSATAVGGLLPLALQGSPLLSPLAWVLIGGLVSSTFAGRLVTPVVYKLVAGRSLEVPAT